MEVKIIWKIKWPGWKSFAEVLWLPGMLFRLCPGIGLELEDIAVIAALLYTIERTKPLYQTGIKIGQFSKPVLL